MRIMDRLKVPENETPWSHGRDSVEDAKEKEIKLLKMLGVRKNLHGTGRASGLLSFLAQLRHSLGAQIKVHI